MQLLIFSTVLAFAAGNFSYAGEVPKTNHEQFGVKKKKKFEVDDMGSLDFVQIEAKHCDFCNGASPNTSAELNKIFQSLNIEIVILKDFEQYSNSDKVQKMIQAARSNLKKYPDRYINENGGFRKTYCYRAVKDALRKSKMVPFTFEGDSVASSGVKDLTSSGFKNLLNDKNYKLILESNPRLAPKGSILVYETVQGAGISNYGHIEIKTKDSGQDGYISISESKRPTYGYAVPQQRKLIGVMIYSPS